MVKHFASCVFVVVSLVAISAAAHEGVAAEITALGVKIQKAPKNTSLYIERAALFRREGQFLPALADLAIAEKLDPQRREIILEKGLTFAAKGATKEAEALLSAYLAAGLPSAKAFEVRGSIREGGKRFVEARADYAAAVALKPDPDLFLARGRMDEKLGRMDDAALGYEEGMRVLSGAVVIRLALIRVENKRGGYDRAISLIDEMLGQIPVKAEWLLLRADQHAAAGRPEKAREDREEALREAETRIASRPNDFARIARAKALRALGRPEDAIKELEVVVGHAPKFDDARILLSEILASVSMKSARK
jgi:tetratricopeptide (TPR) repeat protein